MKKFVSAIGILVALLVALPAQGEDGAIGTGHGTFQAVCAYSHSATDDPIVFPHGPGLSHLHDFFGSRALDSNSTNTSIRNDPSTCTRTNSVTQKNADKSTYWVPAVYVNDKLVVAPEAGVYYTAGIRDLSRIRTFPDNLVMIAGDKNGVAPQENNGQRVYFWECGARGVMPGSARGTITTAPTCVDTLTLTVRFPDCWDGIHSDSPDHKSHMAYSTQTLGTNAKRVCPSTHPVQTPMLQMAMRYPTTGGPTTRLASGAINTAHADFMNGWDPVILDRLVKDCLVDDKYCGGNDGPVAGHN